MQIYVRNFAVHLQLLKCDLSKVADNNPYLENQFIQRIATGDRSAFEELYTLHAAWVSKYVKLYTPSDEDAEEIFQDIFVKIWNKRAQLPQIDNLAAYINRTTRNTIFNYLRSQKLKHQIHSLAGDQYEAVGQTDHRLMYGEYLNMAYSAIKQLPPRRQEVFRLKLEEGLSLDEIAVRLSISRSAVEQHVYGATAFIREYLQKHAGISSNLLLLLFI